MATDKNIQDLYNDIEEIRNTFYSLKDIANTNKFKEEIENINKMLESEVDHEKISELLKRKSYLEDEIKRVQSAEKIIYDIDGFMEIWKETPDPEIIKELSELVPKAKDEIKNLKFTLMLSDKYDRSNAIVEITPGAGGTESMDWAGMLLRMYIRWAQEKGFDAKIIDKIPGEQAGIKSVTLVIEGEFAYGLLKGESGIHRLVRISPFDAAKRRHTSFAAVTVYPEIDDTVEIKINPEEIIIETFRASGPGGQHVNKTDSAVRIKHIPTGIVVVCQNERSQHKNKQIAMKILQSRLYEIEMRKRQEEKESLVEKKDIAWGNQIRSYILHPYKLVKDHRTGYETTQAEKVLDGQIDEFIEEYLKSLLMKKNLSKNSIQN
ncbi:MAG: peptide chain release factor 2 [Candidatus Calescibacterium sp.]|nr:peptide chain release factor 2 [Candidatus Calescibacterium sp.]MCX7734728.1 peptide chain release factor 2 [bacterium]MDW8087290.1 peptide chain release factor 2 [Candidatus Calescibacterium sp.]